MRARPWCRLPTVAGRENLRHRRRAGRRRELFDRVGGFPDLPLMEDIRLSALLKRQAPPACLAETVATSARRWEQNGVLRTILLMWWLRAAFFCGTDPARLARQYGYRNSG